MKHYFYSDGEKQKGPFSFEQLKSENIKKETLIWFEGLDNWKPAAEINDFDEIFKLMPPPIPKKELNTDVKLNAPGSIKEKPFETRDKSESFTNEKQRMFSNLFSFKGRIRRTEYGLSLIIYFALNIILNLVLAYGKEAAAIFVFAYIPLLWVLWAQGAKRLHDMGQNGWFQILPFYVFWMIFKKGELGENKYGLDPKF